MVKLTRIVKKILVKGPQETDKKDTQAAPAVESVASRGLPQPMIDFSNLPVIDHEEVAMRNAERARRKALKTVNRRSLGIAKERGTESSFKNKVVIPKLKGNERATETKKRAPDFAKLAAEASISATKKNKLKNRDSGATVSAKVVKTTKANSRNKRKREAKKEVWRRRYDFSNEAKRLIENFQKEDKHGKALGNLSELQQEVGSLDALLSEASAPSKGPRKVTRKQQMRSKLRNKALLSAALTNI